MATEQETRVHLERDPVAHIARLTIDNPDRRNAYDPPMRRAMGEHLDTLAADDDIKVVILRGAGGELNDVLCHVPCPSGP